MPIVSVCPKCGREGTQTISYKPSIKNPRFQYLAFTHGKHDRCYIGRIKNTDEVMGELNKPETEEEYKMAMEDMTHDIRELINQYAMARSGSVERITNTLRAILEKYGY